MTYFKIPKVTVTFVVGLTYFMTQKGHGVKIEVIVTYFMTPKVTVTFVDSLT